MRLRPSRTRRETRRWSFRAAQETPSQVQKSEVGFQVERRLDGSEAALKDKRAIMSELGVAAAWWRGMGVIWRRRRRRSIGVGEGLSLGDGSDPGIGKNMEKRQEGRV